MDSLLDPTTEMAKHSWRVGIIGNICNVGYSFAKFLRRRGVNATLFVKDRELQPADGWLGNPSSPFHEERDLAPGAVVVQPTMRLDNLAQRAVRRMLRREPWDGCLRQLTRLDLIHAHAMTAIAAAAVHRRAGVPYVAVTTGADITELAFEDSWEGQLYRSALRGANRVLLINTSQWPYAERLGLERVEFLPFLIDTDRYRPLAVPPKQDELLFFSMARLDWSETHRNSLKRNDIFFRGLAAFHRARPDVRFRLRIADWGVDRERARTLIGELELDPYTEFVPPGDKERLLQLLADADAVIDQFHIGSSGVGCLEAMAAGKPVFIFWDEVGARRCYDELPPVANCRTEDEVVQRLSGLASRDALARLGTSARDWVVRHHGWQPVTERLCQIYRDVLVARREPRPSGSA